MHRQEQEPTEDELLRAEEYAERWRKLEFILDSEGWEIIQEWIEDKMNVDRFLKTDNLEYEKGYIKALNDFTKFLKVTKKKGNRGVEKIKKYSEEE